MTVFGRDSLLTSWMLLPLDARVALGTLQAARRPSGQRASSRRPRRSPAASSTRSAPVCRPPACPAPTPSTTARSTRRRSSSCSWASCRRWGTPLADLEPLLPARRSRARLGADPRRPGRRRVRRVRARHAARTGEPGVEGLLRRDHLPLRGAPARTHRARRGAGVRLRRPARPVRAGAKPSATTSTAGDLAQQADALKRAFNDRFWLPHRGHLALALDGDKQPVESLASNMGHCLWTGIVDEEHAPEVAARTRQPRDVQRLRGAHPGLVDGRLQPDELPQRLDLAARQRPGRGGAEAVRVRRGGPAGRARHPRRRGGVRRTPARAVLRLRPRRLPGADPLPHRLRAPGVGGRDAAAPAAGAPRSGTRRPGRRRDGRPGGPDGDAADEGRPAAPGRLDPRAARDGRLLASSRRPARRHDGARE